jgi:hypothetical protein
VCYTEEEIISALWRLNERSEALEGFELIGEG